MKKKKEETLTLPLSHQSVLCRRHIFITITLTRHSVRKDDEYTVLVRRRHISLFLTATHTRTLMQYVGSNNS